MLKYEITSTMKVVNSVIVSQIRALKDFNDVKSGDLGGWVKNRHNLSQSGNCWIYDDAIVYDNAKVYENSEIHGHAEICGYAEICGHANVCENAEIHGHAEIYEHAKVYGKAEIYGNAEVRGDTEIHGNAEIYGNTKIHGHAKVYENAKSCKSAEIYGNAEVRGDAEICGNIIVNQYAVITKSTDVLQIGPIGSRNDITTFFKTNIPGEIYVTCGCFSGDINSFEAAVNITHANNELFRKQYLNTISFAKSIMDL